MWFAYQLFKPHDFIKICCDINAKWKLPRKGQRRDRPRKHDVKSMLFAVLGALRTGISDAAMEAVVGVPESLITVDFERILKILDEQEEGQMYLMNDDEKALCFGAAKSNPYIVYYLDGCDFPLQIAKNAWMYKTHKKNIQKQRGIRAQILIDSLYVFPNRHTVCRNVQNE